LAKCAEDVANGGCTPCITAANSASVKIQAEEQRMAPKEDPIVAELVVESREHLADVSQPASIEQSRQAVPQ
jgi:hypothetical protein